MLFFARLIIFAYLCGAKHHIVLQTIMKKISIKASHLINAAFAAVLGMLGFSCLEPYDMYGTPTGSFEVKGTVTNNNNVPVENAMVILRQTTSYMEPSDTTYTNAKGSYLLKVKNAWPANKVKLVCKPQDNELLADSVYIEPEFKGGNGWDSGTAKIEHDFKLKAKK